MDDDDIFFESPEIRGEYEKLAALALESSLAPPINGDLGHTTTNVNDDEVNEVGDIEQRNGHDSPSIASPGHGPSPQIRVEVAIPEMPWGKRNQYSSIRSDIIEAVLEEMPSSRGKITYNVEYTDGREDLIAFPELVALENGEAALYRYSRDFGPDDVEMTGPILKRKRVLEDEWDSGTDSNESDPMMMDEDELTLDLSHARQESKRPSRALCSRATTRQSSQNISIHSDHDDSDDLGEETTSRITRNLRTRPPRQMTLTAMNFGSGMSQDRDELLNDPRPASSDEEDGDFQIVQSDLMPKKGRSTRARQKSRRIQTLSSRSRASARKAARQKSPDSDIEFEAPRRSGRSTRNRASMVDDSFMDDDSFYVVDDKVPGVPKVISIREVFQPPPSDSSFASIHLGSCHTCGGSKQKGQLVYCQGCTLSYHKHCLGYRSAREHMVTKIGEDDFVLQCKFCIGVYRKKDPKAPKHSTCQACQGEGRACTPFSERKTARQEEKLREQNDGVDPITPVASELINNSDLVLFRCLTCHRGWHVGHLPSISSQIIGTDVKSERLKDYSVDGQCNECSSVKQKMHRLVAWRPLETGVPLQSPHPTYGDVSEDDKEYLIKWENTSYVHCTWMPGAWVFGVCPPTMRTSFGKRDAEQNLLRANEQEAIPDEYIMADVVLNVKMDYSASRAKTKEAELANISKVSKILVKFQGLGYDDVVWDAPPSKEMGAIYSAFAEAYCEYIEGKYFQTESLYKIRDRIKAFKTSPFREVEEQPKGLKRGKLMGYQLEGLNWLLENYHHGRSVVLADEMGLGKTIQVVSLVTSLIQDEPKCWPFLIVVPNATCPNWRREFKQWAPELRVVTYHGGKEPQELAYKYELFPNDSTDMKAHVVIMSYDSAQDPRTKSLFKHIQWTGLVVDEGQRLKNDQNILYVTLREMKIPFRLLLTGTPLQNNKKELFNLLQFIDEKQNAAKLDEEFQVLNKDTLPRLHEKIRPYFLRRTKAGVLKFLPPMAQIILPVSMTVIQEKLSKSIMAKNPELIKAMFANSKINRKERGSLNNILMQLRKCLCHPFIYSEAIEEKHHDPEVIYRNLVEASAKLLLLEIMLPKLKERGHRVLIFSQFLQQLDIIEDFLTGVGFEYRRLDGQISSLEKQRRIDAFNAPESSVFAFLLSTRAGGVGINLATADTVIIMDPDFNPHQDIQALSRAHRIGQKNKVLCFQLMTKDSVEERIMQVGRKKMALDHALIESMDDDELAGDDLESILKHGAQALFNDDYQKDAIHYDAASVDKLLDRTQIEQTKTNEEGSAEAQFSYARVWANDKSGFDEDLGIEEEHEPVPINSSVWDRILAQREEEARKEAEANREVLGRGGRRRMAINYKTSAGETAPILEDVDVEPSDSSDDFAAADSGDDSEADEAFSATKDADEVTPSNERKHSSHNAQAAKGPEPIQTGAKAQKGARKRQEKTTAPNAHPSQTAQEGEAARNRRRSRKPQTLEHRAGAASGFFVGRLVNANPADGYVQGEAGAHYAHPRPNLYQYMNDNFYHQAPPPQAVPTGQALLGNGTSEVQLRLALDSVQRSMATNAQAKEQQRTALLRKLRELSSPDGKQQQ